MEEIESHKGKRAFKAMFYQELRGCERNPIVYSRYSKTCYDPDEKLPEDLMSSCIINIKKLVSEQEETKLTLIGSNSTHKSNKKAKNKPKQYYTPTGPEDKTLVFESRFECGNLNMALKMNENEYNLLLQNDINTNGHTQWFFFRVGNTTKGQTVKFNILNLAKPDSLYNYGMKVL